MPSRRGAKSCSPEGFLRVPAFLLFGQKLHALADQLLGDARDFARGRFHVLPQPPAQKSDAPPAGIGVKPRDVSGRRTLKHALVAFLTHHAPQVQHLPQEGPIPVLAQNNLTHVAVFAHPLEHRRGDLPLGGFRVAVEQGFELAQYILVHIAFDLLPQVVDIAVMRIKRAPVDARYLAQLLDGNALDGLLLEQPRKGLSDQPLGHPHAMVFCSRHLLHLLRTLWPLCVQKPVR